MSKLAKMLIARKTNEVVPTMDVVSVDCSTSPTYAEGYIHTIGCNIEVRAVVEEGIPQIEFDEIQKDAREEIIEQIFGEFRPLIRDVRHALRMYDFDAALQSLRVLQREMFNVEV